MILILMIADLVAEVMRFVVDDESCPGIHEKQMLHETLDVRDICFSRKSNLAFM